MNITEPNRQHIEDVTKDFQEFPDPLFWLSSQDPLEKTPRSSDSPNHIEATERPPSPKRCVPLQRNGI